MRLNGRPVLYAEVPITFVDAPRIEIDKREYRMDRWWSPGQSPAALFRSSDGRFVASEGGVPGGDYFLVAQEAITPDGELSPDELDYLAETDYRIWRVSLVPEMDVRECNLYATGSKQPPQIEFAGSRHHTLGTHVFEERLPDLVLRHWDDENARRFWIFSDDGSGPRRLEADAGCNRLPLRVPCPATGAIWVEARGFFRQASALPHLPFIVLPRGVSIEFSPQCSWIDEPSFARISVPKGWHVRSSHKQTESGMWRIPAKERVLEGALQTGDLRVPFSLRVPRVGVQMHPRDRIWWKENDVPERILHIEGIPGLRCAVWLLDDRGRQEISGPLRIGQKGAVSCAPSISVMTCPLHVLLQVSSWSAFPTANPSEQDGISHLQLESESELAICRTGPQSSCYRASAKRCELPAICRHIKWLHSTAVSSRKRLPFGTGLQASRSALKPSTERA